VKTNQHLAQRSAARASGGRRAYLARYRRRITTDEAGPVHYHHLGSRSSIRVGDELASAVASTVKAAKLRQPAACQLESHIPMKSSVLEPMSAMAMFRQLRIDTQSQKGKATQKTEWRFHEGFTL
jgi:hypothetical protein